MINPVVNIFLIERFARVIYYKRIPNVMQLEENHCHVIEELRQDIFTCTENLASQISIT